MTNQQITQLMKEAGFNTRHFNAYSDEFQAFAQLVRNAVLEDCADVCQKAGYLAMDIHIRDMIRKSKQQVFADVIGKMK